MMNSNPESASADRFDETPTRFEGSGTKFTGTEPIFGAFTNSSTIVTNIRLTHYGQIFVQVLDIGAAITTLAREYRFHGDAVRAYQDIVRIRANFDNRIQQWRAEETNRLQKKKTLNGNQLRDLEKELNRVKLDIARGDSTLNKLQNDLDLISRVGDDCPLLKPQEGEASFADDKYVVPVLEKKKSPSKALHSLARFVKPDGLKLSFQDARFHDDFDDAIREHLYDQKTHLCFVAHWSDRNPVTRDRGEIYLRLLLIPKSIESIDDLPKIIANHDFSITVNGKRDLLEFENLSIPHEKTIVEKKLMDYLYDIEATSFQHKDLIIKRPFEFYAADFCPHIPFDDGAKMEFILNVNRKK